MRDEDGFVERIEQNYEVKPGGSLTLEAEIGSVRVDSWTNDEVEIHIEKRVKGRREERARSAFEEIEVVLSRRENDVHIRVVDNNESIFFRNRVTVEMTIRVPELCTLDLTTVDGDIEVEDMRGPVTARAVDGDIEIDSTEGNVTATTTDGDIDVQNTQGIVTAKAVDGNVDIGHATGDVNARTTGGDIEIHDTKGAVNVNAVDGNIETWSTEGSVDASTLKGHIGVFETLGAVTAKALRGNIDVEFALRNRDSDSRGKSERSMPSASSTSEPPEPTEPLVADPPEAAPDPVTQCNLETTEGDITIYLPDDLPATIEAEGSSGGLVLSRLWRRNIGHIYSDFGMNKSEWGVFFYIQSEASSDINGGGDRFRLSTDSGNIHIKKRNR